MRLTPCLRRAAFSAIFLTGLLAALLLGAGLSRAGREDGILRGRFVNRGRTASDLRFGVNSSYFYFQRTRLPHAAERLPGLSPFGEGFRLPDPPVDLHGRVFTPLGAIDLKHPDEVRLLPAALRRGGTVRRPGWGELADGVNIVQVRQEAIDSGVAIDRELRRFGRIVGLLPERGWVIRPHGRGEMMRLADLPIVEAAMPYHPGLKIDPLVGRMHLIQASRAKDRVLDLTVVAWPGAPAAETEALRRAVAKLAGEDATTVDARDGSLLRVRLAAERVADLADIDEVAGIQETSEFVLQNAEAPSVIMTGSVEDTLGARPYQDIGVDGGGIDTNGDGRRINDGTDLVPPQIVAVTDNGLSLDSVQFSETATQPSTVLTPVGDRHRKVHAIQAVADFGDTCDALLSGAGTHGNVVSGAIAGNASQIGAFAEKTIGVRQPVLKGIVLDGVARGARILMQDAAPVSRCTFNELIERGGNITPGNIRTRLEDARDGGDNVHLQVLPFAIPNFDIILNNPQNGTYSIEASLIDAFLVNNRDYMVFMPVGSQGAAPEDVFQRRYPDLFDGTALDNDPNSPVGLQIPPPATAKNIVTVGSHREDMQTFSGNFNAEEVPSAYPSRGPATAASLRTAPILMSVGEDWNGQFNVPLTQGVAVFRSRDNDNVAPVEAELDEANFGTSYASAYATGAGGADP